MLYTRTNIMRLLKILLFLLLISVISIYAIFRLKDYVSGPQIEINNPVNGETMDSPITKVSGRILRANNLTINGNSTPVDLDGNFNVSILIHNGPNQIEIIASDRFDRNTKKTLEVVGRQ